MSEESPKINGQKESAAGDVLRWLGERRDGFLVGGAVLYGLGYLVWSYNAWRNRLGQLPAAEFQYLVAGIIPAILLTLAWAATAFFNKISNRIFQFFENRKWLRILALLVPSLAYVGTLLLVKVITDRYSTLGLTSEQLSVYTVPLFLVLMYVSLITSDFRKNRIVGKISRLYVVLISLMFFWYSLRIYFEVYPLLPQELGGPQPRCAYVDLVRDDTAPSTLSALAPVNTPELTSTGTKVVRSNKLNVFFASSDYLLVRSADDLAGSGSKLFELRKEVIRSVEWCH